MRALQIEGVRPSNTVSRRKAEKIAPLGCQRIGDIGPLAITQLLVCPGFPVLPAALFLVLRSKVFEPVEYTMPVALGQGMANAQLDHARSGDTGQGVIDPVEVLVDAAHQRVEG